MKNSRFIKTHVAYVRISYLVAVLGNPVKRSNCSTDNDVLVGRLSVSLDSQTLQKCIQMTP